MSYTIFIETQPNDKLKALTLMALTSYRAGRLDPHKLNNLILCAQVVDPAKRDALYNRWALTIK